MSRRRPLRVRVIEVIAETPDASSLVLEPDPADRELFAYRPGQFLTFRIDDAGPGDGAARCYSLSSSPDCDDKLKVTVKRIEGGRGSHWICDTARPGTTLEVLRPAGAFTPAGYDRDLLLCAAGSGITPVMSILKSALHTGSCRVALLYANRDEESVIFGAELAALAREFPGRLTLHHWLESLQGLPTADGLRALAEPYAGRPAYLCGPEPFMDATAGALARLGSTQVHRERFLSLGGDPFAPPPDPGSGTPGTEASAAGPSGGPSGGAGEAAGSVEVVLDGETSTVPWPRGTRLLDTLLAAGLDAPSSCREGACSACAVRVLEGEVAMDRNEVLEQEDLDDGYVLACQATAVTGTLRITYDE